MVIKDTEFTLKDGRRAVIRNARAEEKDSAGLVEYLKISAAETEFILRYPEECDKYTVENEIHYIKSMNESENSLMLVCDVDGKIAGNCQITWSDNLKLRHRADIGIALVSEFWGLGIGTKMFEKMIEAAENNENILQIELEVVEGNSRARALYEKMGFRIASIRPNAIRLRDGTLLNEYTMIRKIER